MTQITNELIHAFVESTIQTVQKMCDLKAEAKPHFLKDRKDPRLSGDIASVLGMVGQNMRGTAVLIFPYALYLRLMSNLLREEITELTQENEDGISEFLNVIYGSVKRILNEKNYSLQKSIPSVIRGEELKTKHYTDQPVHVLPFELEGERFFVEIAIEGAN